MRHLRDRQLDQILTEQVMERKIPFLGICLGMQLMASSGDEGGPTQGLGWIEGQVKRLKSTSPQERIPHVGWNTVKPVPMRTEGLFEGLEGGRDFYFVHSFHFVCAQESDVLARTHHADGFVSAVQRVNIWGVQFHPEKSQRVGFQLLKNFLAIR
jgi:glutamine amidotransferase